MGQNAIYFPLGCLFGTSLPYHLKMTNLPNGFGHFCNSNSIKSECQIALKHVYVSFLFFLSFFFFFPIFGFCGAQGGFFFNVFSLNNESLLSLEDHASVHPPFKS